MAGGGAAAFARKADEATRTAEEATRLKDEAVARDRESRLRGLIQELEYFDTPDDDVYTYARLQPRPAHEWWLERAHELVDGVPDGDPQAGTSSSSSRALSAIAGPAATSTRG